MVWDWNNHVKHECLFVDNPVNSATALFSLSVQVLFYKFTYCCFFWKLMMLKKCLGICHFLCTCSKYFYLIAIFHFFTKYRYMHIIKWYCYLCGVFVSNVMSLLNLKELGSTECNLNSVCVLTVYPSAVCLFNKQAKTDILL